MSFANHIDMPAIQLSDDQLAKWIAPGKERSEDAAMAAHSDEVGRGSSEGGHPFQLKPRQVFR